MVSDSCVAVDRDFNPVVMLKSEDKNFLNHWDPKKKKWTAYPPVVGEKVFNDSRGVITVLSRGDIKRMWHPGEAYVSHPVKHRIHVIDRNHLRRTGNIRGLAGVGKDLALIDVTIQR